MEPWLVELILFLPAIFILGGITSYQDIKEGKIRNKYIIFSLVYLIFAYALLISVYKINNISIRTTYIFDLLINLLIALFVGIALWLLNIWGAADAKLFLAYSALLPLSVYSNTYYRFFPSFALLINTFVPFFIYSFFRFAFFTTMGQKKEPFKKTGLSKLYLLGMKIFWISWIFRLFDFFNIKLEFLVRFAIILILLMLLQKIFKEKLLAVSLALSGLRLIFDYRYIFTFLFLKQFSLLLLIIAVVFFTTRIASLFYVKRIRVTNLKEGMLLAEQIYREEGKKKYKKGFADSLESIVKTKYESLMLEQPAEGLTSSDIKKIQNLYKEKKLSFDEIKIQQTLPFAPFMFFGVLATLISRGNFLSLFKNLF